MKFDGKTLDNIREDLNNVLKSYGIQNNIDFKIGRISYTEDTFRTTLEAFNTENGGDADQIAFEKNRQRFGIPSDWFGKTVTINGKEYAVNGVNPRARKYPISLKNVETGIVDRKATVDMVRTELRLFGKA